MIQRVARGKNKSVIARP